MAAAQINLKWKDVARWMLRPLKQLQEYLALRRAAPPLGGINITPYQNYPVSRSSHLAEISKHELIEPER